MALKSMTGFGRGEYRADGLDLVVEIKAVNHRYSEIVIRMPRVLNALEDRMRRLIAGAVNRGRIDLFVTLEDRRPGLKTVSVDKELAIAYHNALRELAAIAGADLTKISVEEQFSCLLRYPELLTSTQIEGDAESYWEPLQQALQAAMNQLVEMRCREGAHLGGDLSGRIDLLDQLVTQVEARMPEVVVDYEKRLRERLNEIMLKDKTISVDPARLAQEVVLFADKTSVTEEMVRLRSHMKQFRHIIVSGGSVGRKLDFIVQEMNREANTIASKANDSAVAHMVVDMKSELEKIREQVQNIE